MEQFSPLHLVTLTGGGRGGDTASHPGFARCFLDRSGSRIPATLLAEGRVPCLFSNEESYHVSSLYRFVDSTRQ